MVSKIVKRKPRKSFKKWMNLYYNSHKKSLTKRFNDKITLPPLPCPHMKTVFLDLDHTLVHSTDARLYPPPEKYDFVVTSPNDETKVEFYVLKRPFVDEFLKFLSENFEIVVFTAGNKMYASAVIDQLDNRNLISHRLYRNSCRLINGRYVKDLSRTGRDMKSVVLVDDNPDSYELQPENGIPIDQFYDDDEDEELNKLIPFFQGLDSVEDVRDAVKVYQAALYGEEEVEEDII